MAYPRNRYVSNTYKRECDRCGLDYLRVELMKEKRTGQIVCPGCYDPELPRDRPRRVFKEKPFRRD
jgi:hypothetical protein